MYYRPLFTHRHLIGTAVSATANAALVPIMSMPPRLFFIDFIFENSEASRASCAVSANVQRQWTHQLFSIAGCLLKEGSRGCGTGRGSGRGGEGTEVEVDILGMCLKDEAIESLDTSGGLFRLAHSEAHFTSSEVLLTLHVTEDGEIGQNRQQSLAYKDLS